MAEEVIRIELGGSGGQAKSLQDLKKEYKDLQTELSKTKAGSDEYIQTLKKLGATKDEIGDLRDTISALNPEGKVAAFAKVGSTIASGFAAAQGAAALFGAESEELQKTMLKVQAAMALAEGIKGLVAAGDAFNIMATIIKANVISALTTLKGAIAATGLGALAIAIGVLINETMKYNEKIEEEYDKQRKLNEELKKTTDAYLEQAKASEELRAMKKGGLNELERELKLLEASGASAQDIYNKKKQILQSELFDIGVRFKTIEGDETAQLKLKELGKDKRNEIAALEASYEKEIREKSKKDYERYLDEKAKLDKQHSDDLYKQHLDEVAKFEQARKDELEKEKIAQAEADAALKQSAIEAEAEYQNDSFVQQQKANSNKEFEEIMSNERRLENKKAFEKQAVAVSLKAIEATKAFTDLYFSHQLRQAKGNAEKEKEIKKKQFQVDKAFKVASIILNTIQGITQAISSSPPPLSWVLAGINSAIGTAATIAALSQKFDDGGSATGVGDIGGASLGGGAAAPAVPQPNNTVTKIDDEGKVNKMQQPVVKAVVVETDITDKQNRINTIEESAKFG